MLYVEYEKEVVSAGADQSMPCMLAVNAHREIRVYCLDWFDGYVRLAECARSSKKSPGKCQIQWNIGHRDHSKSLGNRCEGVAAVVECERRYIGLSYTAFPSQPDYYM